MNRLTWGIILVIVSSQTDAQNLIFNGSFENYMPPCPTTAPNGSFTQVASWNTGNPAVNDEILTVDLYCGGPNYVLCGPGPIFASDGIAYVGMHTLNPSYNEDIYQQLQVPLIAGNSYFISFDLMTCSSGLFAGGGPSDFCVYTNIDTVIPSCPTTNPTTVNVCCVPFDSISTVTWTHHILQFIAPPNSNVIIFSGNGCNTSYVYYYLDNVVLSTDLTPQASFQPLITKICPDSCISFTNQSTNATSYEWFFQGGNPSYSTDENPNNICYSTSGTYDVTLIAHNGPYSDTTISTNLIQVYAPPTPTIIQSNDSLLVTNVQSGSNFQWSLNGDEINAATNPFFVPTQNGTYSVNVINPQGCSGSDDITMGHIGISEAITENGLLLFPNPADESVTISLNHHQPVQLSLYNTLGQTVYNAMVVNSKTIDISMLPAGVYHLTLQTKTERSTRRLIVTHPHR